MAKTRRLGGRPRINTGATAATARRRERMHQALDAQYAEYDTARNNVSGGHSAIQHGQAKVRGLYR